MGTGPGDGETKGCVGCQEALPTAARVFRSARVINVDGGEALADRRWMVRSTLEDRAGAFVLALSLGAWACANTVAPGIDESEAVPCAPGESSFAFPDLPDRVGPPGVTTGSVPHQQINPDVIPEVIDEMSERIFALPDVESRPSTIVGGATAIWLPEDLNLGRPECVISQRELGHIHQDGSLHVTLPHGRIPGAAAAGWVERHPWADTRPGFEAYVMIFSPRDSSEVDVIFDLIIQGIDFVKGS
jgi:phospholipase/carboxylesterase